MAATTAAGRWGGCVPRLLGAAGPRSRRGGCRTNCAKGVCGDAPRGSRALLSLNCPVGCGFVSGLFAQPHGRRPRWVSASRSSHFAFALNAHPFGTGYLRVSSDRRSMLSFALAFRKRPCAANSSSRRLRGSGSVDAAADKQRPDNARRLIGESDGDDACRPTGQQLLGPNCAAGAAGVTHQRCSAENEKSANVPIALLRDAPETLTAAGRILFWCQPEKGCKVASRLELCRGSNRGGDGRSRNDADTGDCRQPATGVVVSIPGPDRLLDLLDASL